MDEYEYVVCQTKRSMPVPPVPSDSVTCSKCGAELWRAKSSPRDIGAICYACCYAYVVEVKEKPFIVMTKAQLEDVIRYSQSNQNN